MRIHSMKPFVGQAFGPAAGLLPGAELYVTDPKPKASA